MERNEQWIRKFRGGNGLVLKEVLSLHWLLKNTNSIKAAGVPVENETEQAPGKSGGKLDLPLGIQF
jgi:hypothetical protein